jgi:hypothetical protein
LKEFMKKVSLVLAITLGAVFFAWSQTNGGQAKKSELDGTWELVAGQQLPKGAREIDGDTFKQAGTLSNGKGLSETWKRVSRER